MREPRGDERITAGIDVGSSAVKVAVVADRAEGSVLLAGRVERLRRRAPEAVARGLFDTTLEEAGVREDEVAYVATTGEGERVDFRTGHFYGMTTHARGGLFLEPAARGIVDMGALHTRAVAMDARSRVTGYRMTSQCASGSGQFLENIARYLGVSLEEVGALSIQADTPEVCSSICAVLAETDVINMVSRGISLPNILKGIHKSMAGRCVRLVVSIGSPAVLLITGGLANDQGLVAAMRETAIEQHLSVDIRSHPQSILAGAVGAALWGAFRARRLQRTRPQVAS